jgi:hypothetical protein
MTMPRQRSELIKWLHARGFKANPFEYRVAENEVESLPDYFVFGRNETFLELQGEPANPQTAICSGEPGSGKSALAYMLELDLRQAPQNEYGRVLPISFRAQDYLTFLQTKELNWRQVLLNQIRHHLNKQKQMLYGDNPVPDLSDLELSDLTQAPALAGLDAIWFLLDKLEDLKETNGKPTVVAEFLQPLLSDKWLVNNAKNLVFKIFITPQIEQELVRVLGKNQFERFNVIYQNWDEADLEELLTRRLEYFSKSSVSSLGEFSEVPELDTRLCQAAEGSPRRLLHLGKNLLDNHRKTRPQLSDKILRKTFELTIEGFDNKPPEIQPPANQKAHVVIVHCSQNDRWLKRIKTYLHQLSDNTFKVSFWNETVLKGMCEAGQLSRQLKANDSIVLLLSNELLGSSYRDCKATLIDFLRVQDKLGIFPVLVDVTPIERFGLGLYQPVNPEKSLGKYTKTAEWQSILQKLIDEIENQHKNRL